MQIKYLLMALAAVTLLALAVASASAQVGRIEGVVKKQGSGEPIEGAVVDIIREDIKGNYGPLKTNKKGEFLHAGVPYVGRYTILVSAPGCAPYYATGVRPTGEQMKIELGPGDGRRLTMEDVKQAQSAAPQRPMSEAEIKKQQEEYEKKRQEIEKQKADFETMKKRFEEGLLLANNKDYSGAIAAFKEAAQLDPEQQVIHANLALALYNRGATQLNAGQRDPAKQDFTDSVSAITQALNLIEKQLSDPAKAAEAKKTKANYLKIRADSEGVLAKRFGDASMAEAAVKDYREAAALTDDPRAKKDWPLKAAETLFDAGKAQEAIVAYQEILETDPNNIEALYRLGLAYASAEKFQESADTLQKFVDKAPDSDPRVAEAKAVIQHLVVGNNLKPPKSEPETKGSTTRKRRP